MRCPVKGHVYIVLHILSFATFIVADRRVCAIMASMVVLLDAGYRSMAERMAEDRRKRCRALGRVDQSTGKDEEQKWDWEFLGASGELAVARAFNLCPDFGEEAGKADFTLPSRKTLDVKTVNYDSRGKNLLVRKSAVHCDVYVLVEHLGFARYNLVGWESGETVRASPVGKVQKGCHFVQADQLRNCNCKNFLEGLNRLELPAAGDLDPPPPLPEPFESCNF